MIFSAGWWITKYLGTGSVIAVAMLYGFTKVGNPFTPHGTGYKVVIRGDKGEIKDQSGRTIAHVEAKTNNVISGGGCDSTVITCKNNRAVITTLSGVPLVEFENQEGVVIVVSFNKEEVSDMDIKQCFGKAAINVPVLK